MSQAMSNDKLFDVYNIRRNCKRELVEIPFEMIEEQLNHLKIPFTYVKIVPTGMPIAEFLKNVA